MPATQASQVNLTWSTEATLDLGNEAVSAFTTRAHVVRGEFEGRLVSAILAANSQTTNLPNDPVVRGRVQSRLFEVMDYVGIGESRVLDFRRVNTDPAKGPITDAFGVPTQPILSGTWTPPQP